MLADEDASVLNLDNRACNLGCVSQVREVRWTLSLIIVSGSNDENELQCTVHR